VRARPKAKPKDTGKQIKQSKKAIAELEQKRSRSQAALISSILNQTDLKDEEVDYFNHFSEKIDLEGQHLQTLTEEYET
jgi:hypothetical protein